MDVFESNLEDFQDRRGADARALVRFFIQPVKNEKKSAEEGRPIYEDREYCEIIVPGNKTNRPIKPVTEIVKKRFPQQYAKWKATGEGDYTGEGTPLTEVPWISRSQVEELAYWRIRSLEQLAGITDEICTKTIGLYELRRKAQLHIDAAAKIAPLESLREELEQRDAQIAALETSINEQAKLIKKLEAKLKE